MKHLPTIRKLIGAYVCHHGQMVREATFNLAGEDLSLIERCQLVGILLSCTTGNVAFKGEIGEDLNSELVMNSSPLSIEIEKISDEMLEILALALLSVLRPVESLQGLHHIASSMNRPLDGIDSALKIARSNLKKA